ncbi:MAG: DegT/DnrJ/EryC1/StrS family aminotransferase [Verrucomicrobiota bacterium]
MTVVPLFDLKEQNRALEDSFRTAFDRVLASGQFILGKELEQFEEKVAAYLGVRHSIGVSSGTDALLLALMALKIQPGDEVICPSFTFFATAGSIARLGAVPVFVDCCPVCFNIDAEDAAKKISKKTRAIMPVHLFGQAANMDALARLADGKNIAIIEDAAQAIGAIHKSKKVGGIGTLGAFSFFPTKNLGGFGDSGMLTTNDGALADFARILRVHGSKPKYYHHHVGGNFRMDPLQAALLSVKLNHLDEYAENRRLNARFYSENLSKISGAALAVHGNHCPIEPDFSGARLILPTECEYNHHIWNQYTLRVIGDKRDALRQFLQENGVGAEIYYPVPLHQQECFKPFIKKSQKLPQSKKIAQECLSIPIFPELTSAQKTRVVEMIAEFFKKR